MSVMKCGWWCKTIQVESVNCEILRRSDPRSDILVRRRVLGAKDAADYERYGVIVVQRNPLGTVRAFLDVQAREQMPLHPDWVRAWLVDQKILARVGR